MKSLVLPLFTALLTSTALAAEPAAPTSPLKIVVLGATTNALHLSLGKYEAKKETNEALNNQTDDAVEFIARSTPRFEVVKVLSRAERDADPGLFQHLALLDVVVSDIASVYRQGVPMGPPISPQKSPFIIGPGLAPLTARYGAQYGLLIRVDDPSMSGGLIAMEIFSSALGLWASNGNSLTVSDHPPRLTAALVDLDTGTVVWVNDLFPAGGVDDREDILEHIDYLLCQYPYANRIGQYAKLKSCRRDFEIAKDGSIKWD